MARKTEPHTFAVFKAHVFQPLEAQVQPQNCTFFIIKTIMEAKNREAEKKPNNRVSDGNISDLKFDNKNFNKHTEFGMSLLEKSLRRNGAGRSIVVDKNGRIIGGNGIVETAASIGLDKTIVVETTGDKLVVVKRTDVDLDSKQGREMALADNATAAADMDLDIELIKVVQDEVGFDANEWGIKLIDIEEPGEASKEAVEDDFNEGQDCIKVLCSLGDIWQLGEHRLMCGDSTKLADVQHLMGGGSG